MFTMRRTIVALACAAVLGTVTAYANETHPKYNAQDVDYAITHNGSQTSNAGPDGKPAWSVTFHVHLSSTDTQTPISEIVTSQDYSILVGRRSHFSSVTVGGQRQPISDGNSFSYTVSGAPQGDYDIGVTMVADHPGWSSVTISGCVNLANGDVAMDFDDELICGPGGGEHGASSPVGAREVLTYMGPTSPYGGLSGGVGELAGEVYYLYDPHGPSVDEGTAGMLAATTAAEVVDAAVANGEIGAAFEALGNHDDSGAAGHFLKSELWILAQIYADPVKLGAQGTKAVYVFTKARVLKSAKLGDLAGQLVARWKSGGQAVVLGSLTTWVAQRMAECDTVVCASIKVVKAATGLACFVPGTPIQMADGTTKPIERVRVGDLVWSRNAGTGVTEPRRVIHTTVRRTERVLDLIFTIAANGKKEHIVTTSEHPFYVKGRGFVRAGSLGIGTQIVTRAGPAAVVTATHPRMRSNGYTVYNLTVEADHTYFVGRGGGGVWVHNALSCELLAKIAGLAKDLTKIFEDYPRFRCETVAYLVIAAMKEAGIQGVRLVKLTDRYYAPILKDAAGEIISRDGTHFVVQVGGPDGLYFDVLSGAGGAPWAKYVKLWDSRIQFMVSYPPPRPM